MKRSALLHDVARIPDPLRRCRVPKDLDEITTLGDEIDPTDVGMTREGVENIWAGVRGLYKSGIHPAITLVVRRQGQIVVNRGIGHARGNGPDDKPETPKVLAGPETPFGIFSASKAITATLIHLLDERGLLHIGDPVAHYLPEFARNGKQDITIGQVLSHRAGVPAMPKGAMDLDRINDWQFHRELMYDSKPVFRPGKRQAYHAVSGGAVLGEVVREITGKSIRDVLAETILEPLGFRWTNYGVAPEDLDLIGKSYPTGPVLIPPASTLITRALGGVNPDHATRLSNDPRFMTSVMPAASGVSTAEELGRFFEMLLRGGQLEGVRVMEERTVRRAVTPVSRMELDLSLILPMGYSNGFMLGSKMVSLFGPDTERAFGHLGWINIVGWADPERDLSVGLITTGKAPFYPEVLSFLDVPRRIGAAAPKVS